MTDPNARLLQRQLFAGAFETELDRQGRVLVPQGLRAFAGLESDAMVLGSRDHAEIWAPARWDEYSRASRIRPPSPPPSPAWGSDVAPNALPGSARDPQPHRGGEMQEGHLSVMPAEVIATLAPAPGSLQIDATVGGGGHTERILEAASPDGRVLGLDADAVAIERVGIRLARYGDRLVLRRANFRELAAIAPGAGFGAVDGALFDLGLSSFQLADRERGFGFRAGGPLDMRFDTTRGVPASELLATLSADELAALFRKYGEEPSAWKIAKAIVAARETAPIATAEELAALDRAHLAPQPARPPPDPPGDAGLPGAADRGQRGARRARGGPRGRRGPAASGRADRGPVLPLAGGPDRQAVPRRRASRLHLPAGGARLRLREGAASPPRDQAVAHADGRRDHHEPAREERPASCSRAARRMSDRR